MLSIFLLSVIMLNVVMLSVVALFSLPVKVLFYQATYTINPSG
jgi:hypothetical protein